MHGSELLRLNTSYLKSELPASTTETDKTELFIVVICRFVHDNCPEVQAKKLVNACFGAKKACTYCSIKRAIKLVKSTTIELFSKH